MNSNIFFPDYFKNAVVNCILIMDSAGDILEVSNSFTENFGYTNTDIAGKNFSILFTNKDIKDNRHLIELQNVHTRGQSTDDNCVVDKYGNCILCTGESLLVTGEDGNKYIVKDVVNLQTKKHVQSILTNTQLLLDKIFLSTRDIPMLVLDGFMKIHSVNEPFIKMFGLTTQPPVGSRVFDLSHAFWQSSPIKDELRSSVINKRPFVNEEFWFESKNGINKRINLNSIIIKDEHGTKKYIMFEDLPAGK